ncbi:MAG: hypothetical protein L0Y44_12705 [Phycisphaerales bacterium]|nr:hypothetical protein [Phycisphaerales bacterium]MCI0675893.1 hypothetical protein [Phycisphaerales bacterium]
MPYPTILLNVSAVCLLTTFLARSYAAPPPSPNLSEAVRQSTSAPLPQRPPASIDIMLPEPIEQRGFDRYADLLVLSEEQITVFKQHFAAYQEHYSTLEGTLIGPLWQKAAELHVSGVTQQPAAYESLMKDRASFADEVSRLDTDLFDAMVPVLSEKQQHLLQFVRLDRLRTFYSSFFLLATLPEARVDLITLISLTITDPTQRVHSRDVEHEYLQAMVPLLRRHADSRLENMVKDAYLMGSLAAVEGADQEKKHQFWLDMMAQRAKLAHETILVSERMEGVNREFLRRFVEQLGDAGARLHNAYYSKAYPSIHPDLTSAESTVRSLLAVEHLTDEQRDAIQAIAGDYRTSYKAINETLQKLVRDWQEQLALNMSYDANKLAEFTQNVDDLKANRDNMNTSCRRRMMELLTPEQKASLPPVRQTPERTRPITPAPPDSIAPRP